jgi:hypothetical protein
MSQNFTSSMSSGTIIWSMASTKKTQLRTQALAFADAIQRIIGQAIGHGYQDGCEGKQVPDKQCKAFADVLIDELRKSCTEWAEGIIGSDEGGWINEEAITRNDLRAEQRERLRKTIGKRKMLLPHLPSEPKKKPSRVK